LSSSNAVVLDKKALAEGIFAKFSDVYGKLISTVPTDRQEPFVRDYLHEVERRNKYLVNCQEWMSSLSHLSVPVHNLPSSSHVSPSNEINRSPTVLNVQQPEFTSENTNTHVNIVPDEKSIKNNGCQEDDGLVSLGESAASKSSRMSAKAKLEKAQAK